MKPANLKFCAPASLRSVAATATAALLTVSITGCQPSGPATGELKTEQPPEPEAPAVTLQPAGAAPAIGVSASSAALPDFAEIGVVSEKKNSFFNYLRPMIDAENQQIGRWKQYLTLLEQQLTQQGDLHPQDRDWLMQLAKKHRLKESDATAQIQLLQKMIGELPEALVLAQAANESAWGTSRFARKGNNLFGMWCFTPGCGITPLGRPEGASYEVQAFRTVASGVHHYFTNLNANKSYHRLRGIRRCLNASQLTASGRALAAGLTEYSARGGHYVEELRSMMRVNRLEAWDQNWWGKQSPEHPCYKLVQVQVDKPDPIIKAETLVAAVDHKAGDSAEILTEKRATETPEPVATAVSITGTPEPKELKVSEVGTTAPEAAGAAEAGSTPAEVTATSSAVQPPVQSVTEDPEKAAKVTRAEEPAAVEKPTVPLAEQSPETTKPQAGSANPA